MKQSVCDALNEHMKLEFAAWYVYMDMAHWLAEADLPGFAGFMTQQSDQELTHAKKIITHLQDRAQKVMLEEIPKPHQDWGTVQKLFEEVLIMEQEVTASIEAVYSLAEKEADRPAQLLLQWFIEEQVEEENVARALLGRLKYAGDGGVGLLMIDQELAKGPVPGAMEEGGITQGA